jgi:hypothetical protein
MCSICFANSAAASLLILVRLRGGKRMERRHSNMNLTSPTVLDQAYLNLRRGFDRVPLIEAKLADLSAAAKALTNSGRSLKRSTAHIRHVAKPGAKGIPKRTLSSATSTKWNPRETRVVGGRQYTLSSRLIVTSNFSGSLGQRRNKAEPRRSVACFLVAR